MPWALPESDAGLLALAKTYPFDAPDRCYLFAAGEAEPLSHEACDGPMFRGRRPVLAHGSNRAPAQLRRKYGEGAEIPVTFGWLHDYDVVYSAHVTQYGAIASTLQRAPGARTRLAVNWLTEAQLQRMHETEGPSTYRHGRMRGIRMDLDRGPVERLHSFELYLSTNGCLSRAGAAVGMAAIASEGRPHRALHQEAVLTHVRDRYRPGADLDELILRKIRDKAARQALVAEMRAEAVAAVTPHFEEIGR